MLLRSLYPYWHDEKTYQKWQKNDKVYKYRGLIPTIQPEPEFSWTCSFHKLLDSAELILYMKYQKIWMTGWQKTSKIAQIGFSPICDFPRFFLKLGSDTFVPLWFPEFMQNKTKYTIEPRNNFLMKTNKHFILKSTKKAYLGLTS